MTPYKLAERFIGTKEVPGSKDNSQILAMLHLDEFWPEHDEVPWCSAFCNYICWLLRLPRSKSLMARSWLDVGIPIHLDKASIGPDVAVFSRGTNPTLGHVGFFSGKLNRRVYVLGGNQSDKVSVSDFDIDQLLGIQRIAYRIDYNVNRSSGGEL